jgi:hypothetical protein
MIEAVKINQENTDSTLKGNHGRNKGLVKINYSLPRSDGGLSGE